MSVTCAFVSRTPRSSTIVNTGWSSPAAGTLNQRRVSLLSTVVKNDRSAPSYASKRSNEAAATSRSVAGSASEPSFSITIGS